MPNLYPLARSIFGLLPAEYARDLTVRCLEIGLGGWMVDRSAQRPDPPLLSQRVWDLTFANPLGLAAGFDKDARVPDAVIGNWGLGFAEVGTVTPRQQRGNPKPRVFRLKDDNAIINRMGFNSCGLPDVVKRLKARRTRGGIIGLNLGKNRETGNAAADYEEGIRATVHLVDYLVINVSSPNTPGLRDLQRRAPLENLLRQLIAVRDSTKSSTPLLVKIAPDLSSNECEDIVSVAMECGINGIVISNTTTDHLGLKSSTRGEEGGVSGRPLFEKSTKLLAKIYTLTGGQLPLIGVGGISSAADAFEKICAGASLIQLYTALAFEGPMLASKIKFGLANLLMANGFSSVQAAVGSRSAAWVSTVARPTATFATVTASVKATATSPVRHRRSARKPSPLRSM